ncbi:uncharacterized protein SRS1_12086 [Sporisorium reilianum f. sp. reilianum]|uniref:Uncharacterized protein n=1 Tax=Sporisorium reilianum f. sp. reilianum TaxID=72559 RepID=A0A2N8U818_9BASI|nr:uncharacterized protein SRS1_12086 [Sporisorium reilianum f. sp. reilianum]
MWIAKTSALAAALALGVAMPVMVSAETTVTTETRDYDPNEYSGKPAHPLFACKVKSTHCTAADDLTGVPYIANLQLNTCQHRAFFVQMLANVFTRRRVRNTFWVYCQDKDKDKDKVCETYVKKTVPDYGKIADDLAKSINDQTNCDATFHCYGLEDMKKGCEPK